VRRQYKSQAKALLKNLLQISISRTGFPGHFFFQGCNASLDKKPALRAAYPMISLDRLIELPGDGGRLCMLRINRFTPAPGCGPEKATE